MDLAKTYLKQLQLHGSMSCLCKVLYAGSLFAHIVAIYTWKNLTTVNIMSYLY